MDLLARTGVGRDINRHFYTPDEVEAALQRPVVRRLLELIRLRNTHAAFDGQFSLKPGEADDLLTLRWDAGEAFVELQVDFAVPRGTLRFSPPDVASPDSASPHVWTFAPVAEPSIAD
jgi:sucrose phosphorylase